MSPQRKKPTRHELGLRVNELLGHNQQLALHMAACHNVMKIAHKEACEGYDSLNLSILPNDRKNRKRFEEIATLLGPFLVEPPEEEDGKLRAESDPPQGQDCGRGDGKDSQDQDRQAG